MKLSKHKLLVTLTVSLFALNGCKKEKIATENPFIVTEHFVGGTIRPKSGSYTSVFLIKLLTDNKAVFLTSGRDFAGDYVLTKDSLIVTVSDPNNYRIAKFAISQKHELTSAYYKALTTEYDATGELITIGNKNQLAGKRFKGEEFKMGGTSYRKDLVYKFAASGTTFGADVEANADDKANTYELINNNAFRFKDGARVEFGFASNKKLTVFRLSGLYYYGKYDQQ